MAELMRKFFEMNDMDVVIVAILYFAGVVGCFVYFWKKEDEDRRV